VAVFDARTSGALTVKIFERSGKLVVSSPPFSDWWGLAWTPANELWFAATEAGAVQTAVFGLDLHGRERVVYRAPGAFTLHDISPQGDRAELAENWTLAREPAPLRAIPPPE
jgi:hypothetical protein